MTLPADARGMVVFAHGSGSSRHSPRNRFVARVLNQVGLATLLFDLLTPDEELRPSQRLRRHPAGARLEEVTGGWPRSTRPPACPSATSGPAPARRPRSGPPPRRPGAVDAVVSRGGRPDLALARLPDVVAPTLLVVGERDEDVLALNRQAQAAFTCENRLVTVPHATHLFEEPGTLQVAADLAADWFLDHLPTAHG